MRTRDELQKAASCVNGEWALLADTACLMPRGRSGSRTQAETAVLEATLVHARCLINFTCGNYAGNHQPSDIQPADFLGVEWWPHDEPFERKLRGRLRFINQEFQHLSWQRVDDEEMLLVSVTLLAHEVHWAMHLFVEELRAKASDWLPTFGEQERYVWAQMPSLGRPAETVPARRSRPRESHTSLTTGISRRGTS